MLISNAAMSSECDCMQLCHVLLHLCTCLRAKAPAANRAAAAMPAAVPSRLTAPSVPRGTVFSVVIKYVVFP